MSLARGSFPLLRGAISEPSALGTRAHWKSEYSEDLHRYDEQGDPMLRSLTSAAHEDVEDDDEEAGTLWFGASVAAKHVDLAAPFCAVLGARVVDVGTGNGEVLCRLAERHRASSYLGTDYIADACVLARRVAKSQRRAYEQCAGRSDAEQLPAIDFIVDDIFRSSLQAGSFDVVLDKGTLDALSLVVAAGAEGDAVETIRKYVVALARLARGGGVLIVTTANFTLHELDAVMTSAGWAYESKVEDYPTFRYGDIVGTHVRTLLFRKRKRNADAAGRALRRERAASEGGDAFEFDSRRASAADAM
jgi:SAM-dependent methyltransferase